MRDADIRKVLHQTEIKRLCLEDPTSLVIDELGLLEGKYRMDVAVINGKMHGYEIKSASDNLERLPKQQKNYDKIFDKITLVADEKHVVQAMKIVPTWWGLMTACWRNGEPALEEIWPARLNFAVDPYCLSQLLWRDEAWKLLREKGLGRGMSMQRRKHLWRVLAEELPLEDLKEGVRHALKVRTDWRH